MVSKRKVTHVRPRLLSEVRALIFSRFGLLTPVTPVSPDPESLPLPEQIPARPDQRPSENLPDTQSHEGTSVDRDSFGRD